MPPKSPFYIVQNFISPLLCEEIVDEMGFLVAEQNNEGLEVKTVRTNDKYQEIIFERLLPYIPTLEAYYGFEYKGTEQPINFEWFPEQSQGDFICENSAYLRKKWLRTKQRDISGILFLADYQDNIPFEKDFEVYGGKLEFPQWQFGFNPQRGTLVLFPSVPNFINITSRIFAGDLYQARLHLAATSPYLYVPEKFPGDINSWFKDVS